MRRRQKVGDIPGARFLKQSSLLEPTLMLLAFVFVLIGFGTKPGYFPCIARLPDAHAGEAPSPVSALLSAVLLNCALLVLIRYYIIICQTIGAAISQPVVAHLRHVVGCRGGIFHSGTAGH